MIDWEAIFLELEETQVQEAEEYYESVKKDFEEEEHHLEVLLLLWFAQYLIESLNDAKKLLTVKELRTFKSQLADYRKKAIDSEWDKTLKLLQGRKHISRLQVLQTQLAQVVNEMFFPYESTIEQFLVDSYKQNYYRTAYQLAIGTQRGIVLDAITDVVFKPWAVDGRVFSERIWRDKIKLINELNTILTRGLVNGTDPHKMVDLMVKRLNISRSNAARLIATESVYARSLAQQQVYRDTGVSMYRLVATLDSRTSAICRSMHGREFKLSDFEVGVTAPPFHPRCRTVTTPSYSRIPEGEIISADMSYEEWYNKFIK